VSLHSEMEAERQNSGGGFMYERKLEKLGPALLAEAVADLKKTLGGNGNGQNRSRKPSGPAEEWTAVGAEALIAKNIPPRLSVMEENGQVLFYESSINQIMAWRGVGKTNFALGMADAIASGGRILNFQSTRARRVLYVDGELPLAQLQERVKAFIGEGHRHNVSLFSPEMLATPRGLNLLEERDFLALQKLVVREKTEVLLIDSQSTTMQGDALIFERWAMGRLH